MSHGLIRALAGCAVGGGLILVAQAVTWSHASVARPGGGVQHVSVTGHAVAPGLPAAGWALLALTLALLAANGLMRRIVGALAAIVGITGVAIAVGARGAVSQALANAAFSPPPHPVHAGAGIWWVIAALGGVLAALAGAAAVVRGGRWGGMGARYDSPVGAGAAATGRPSATGGEPVPAGAGPSHPAADDAEAWRALDRGEDPTAG